VFSHEEEIEVFLKIIERAGERMKTDIKYRKKLFKGSPILTRDGKLKRKYWDVCIKYGLISP
jgi:hypothetical protein